MKTYIVNLRGNKKNNVGSITFEIQAGNKTTAFSNVWAHFQEDKHENDYFKQKCRERVLYLGFPEELAGKYSVMRTQIICKK
jgi:hypothetical protein